MSTPGCEIERVYLLDRLPELDVLDARMETWRIDQGYLVPTEAPVSDVLKEGRIRRVELPDGEIRFIHTIKRGLGLVREEHETEISEEEFNRLWPLTDGRRIRKVRTRIQEGALTWELDRFLDIELVLAEVELPEVETVVELPEWLKPRIVREVTEDPAFRNFELARQAGLLGEAEEESQQ